MKLSLKKIRKINYSKHKKRIKAYINVDISDWYRNPYTGPKARFYNEVSSIIIFILQNTKITPNLLTLTYAFLGLLSGVFLASNNYNLVFLSLLILFSKSSLDWADGELARIKKQTSELGDLLDHWAGHVGTYSFLCGLGIYLYNNTGDKHFVALAIIIILLKSLDIKNYAYQLSMYKIFQKGKKNKLNKKTNKKSEENKYGASNFLVSIKYFYQNFLGERSRTTDFICLLIFIDTFYARVSLLNYIYYLIFLRNFVLFCGGFYITYFKDFLNKIK